MGLLTNAQRFLKGTPDKNGVGRDYNVSLGKGNNVGAYTEKGLASVGGKLGKFGGTVGIANGKPFGSYNINGKVGGSFGPQGQ